MIRPCPDRGSLADIIRAIGSTERDEHGATIGARTSAELHAWCEEIAKRAEPSTVLIAPGIMTLSDGSTLDTRREHALQVRILELEAQLVDLLALELEVVNAYKRAGALALDAPPPTTRELLAMVQS